MGESATETVREIEQTRDRLEDEFRELEQRLPAPGVWAKRLIGVAVGGGVGGSAFWFAARKLRKRRKQKVAQRQVQAVVNVLPERWAENVSAALEDGRWKGWAAAAGGAWLLFRLAELRQLRRMNRALIVAR
jgi:hypothetical protein